MARCDTPRIPIRRTNKALSPEAATRKHEIIAHTERVADLPQRWEHDIDRERRQRHKERDQRHEL
jgi:hypothetical protein